MEKAEFSLKSYRFDKIFMDLENIPSNVTFNIEFTPTGKFIQKEHLYNLNFEFRACIDKEEDPIITIGCTASFEFKNNITFEEIPSFFYPNSIAIVFPYVRAFGSTITLQANVKPILMPTLNLTSL